MDNRRDAKWRYRRAPTRRYDSYEYDYEQWYKNDYHEDYGYAGGQYNEGSWQRLDQLYGPHAGIGVPPMQVMATPERTLDRAKRPEVKVRGGLGELCQVVRLPSQRPTDTSRSRRQPNSGCSASGSAKRQP